MSSKQYRRNHILRTTYYPAHGVTPQSLAHILPDEALPANEKRSISKTSRFSSLYMTSQYHWVKTNKPCNTEDLRTTKAVCTGYKNACLPLFQWKSLIFASIESKYTAILLLAKQNAYPRKGYFLVKTSGVQYGQAPYSDNTPCNVDYFRGNQERP